MLMLPFCGLASGEVKLVELVSMPGTPSLLQGGEMRRSCACSDWRFAFCVCPTNTKGKRDRRRKKKIEARSSLASCRLGAQLAGRLCDLFPFALPSFEGAASRLLGPSRCWADYSALKGGRRGKCKRRWQARDEPWGSLCN